MCASRFSYVFLSQETQHLNTLGGKESMKFVQTDLNSEFSACGLWLEINVIDIIMYGCAWLCGCYKDQHKIAFAWLYGS